MYVLGLHLSLVLNVGITGICVVTVYSIMAEDSFILTALNCHQGAPDGL